MDLYSELFLEHVKHPHNYGSLENFTNHDSQVNTFCGDGITVQLLVAKNKVLKIAHKTEGCAVSIASASILSDQLVGKTVAQVKSLNEKDVIKLLGISLTITRVKCAMMPLVAIKNALCIV